MMLNRAARYLLAAIQALIGWEWLMSGSNKILSGVFPQGLANTLQQGIQGNPNGWYVSFLQSVVQPHSVFFGYLIEWTELTIGVVLVACAALLLSAPRRRGEPQHTLVVSFFSLGSIVAVLGAFLCINFHFWMGRGLIPGIGTGPNDEGIDLDALIPPLSLIILIANLAFIKALRSEPWYSRTYKRVMTSLRRFIGMENPSESKTAV